MLRGFDGHVLRRVDGHVFGWAFELKVKLAKVGRERHGDNRLRKKA